MTTTKTMLPTIVGLAFLLIAGAAGRAEDVRLLFEGSWTKGGYAIEGGWSIVEERGTRFVVLDEDFKTRRAPDLKIFLSPLPLTEISDRNATSDSALVAPLERHSGAHRYAIGEDVDLECYRSIIIHCEQYAKYWGGATLVAPAEQE